MSDHCYKLQVATSPGENVGMCIKGNNNNYYELFFQFPWRMFDAELFPLSLFTVE